MACCRPYGRRRAPRIPADDAGEGVLIDCTDLVVCDQCWHAAGGNAAVVTRLTGGTGLEPALVFDPAFDALLAAAAEYDLLHPIDRLLVESGVRWAVLRHIAVPARMQLAGQVLRRSAPEATRSADSARVWLDAVEARIRAQTGAGQAGPSAPGRRTRFVYNAKRRRWWRIANLFACMADRDARPLTWITQEEIAAVVGCSTRTVRRAVAWLRAEGLLWEVVPGCRLPQQHVPDGETPAEATERRARLAAAVAAEEAAIARARARSALARAELDAVDDGHTGPDAAAAAQLALPDDIIAALAPAAVLEDGADGTEPLVNLSPVYELRVPTEAPAPDLVPAGPPAAPAPATVPHSTALNCGNTGRPDPVDEFVRPPQVCLDDQLQSSSQQSVDKRRAPRGPWTKEFGGSGESAEVGEGVDDPQQALHGPAASARGDSPRHRQSRAVTTAQRLLRYHLHVTVREGVSVSWLASQIRASGLLDAGWSDQDLADLIHGVPESSNLPRHIRNPRGWIVARLQQATPTLPPSRLRTIISIERGSRWFKDHRAEGAAAELRAAAEARQAAIDACDLCDEHGWLDVPRGVPEVLCNHDVASAGW